MEQSPYIYNLSSLLEYTKDGDFAKTATLEFQGPTMAVFKLSSKLSQLMMRAMMDSKRDEAGQENKDITAEEAIASIDETVVKMVLMRSSSVEFSEVADVAIKLFCQVGTYDGKLKLRETAFNSISVKDFTELVCGYIANFIIPSLF